MTEINMQIAIIFQTKQFAYSTLNVVNYGL